MWLIGTVAMLAVVIAVWLRAIPIVGAILVLPLFGGIAAISRWVLRDQNFDELPE